MKALANKEMVALTRVKADGKVGPTVWVDPQRVRERKPELVDTIEKEPGALELLISQRTPVFNNVQNLDNNIQNN